MNNNSLWGLSCDLYTVVSYYYVEYFKILGIVVILLYKAEGIKRENKIVSFCNIVDS